MNPKDRNCDIDDEHEIHDAKNDENDVDDHPDDNGDIDDSDDDYFLITRII